MTKDWTIQQVWNETILASRKEGKARNHISASDIGKNFYERYLKMQGVPASNPFDERTIRKFEAGNLFEWLVKNVLKRAGVLHSYQDFIEIPENEKHLKVIGYLDLIAGGIVDWKEAEEKVKTMNLPENLQRIADAVVLKLQNKFPNGIEKLVYEIKSINSMVFWAKTKANSLPYPWHKLQLLTYLKGTGAENGRIIYISKDDLTLAEYVVRHDDENLNKIFNDDIETMSAYIREKKEPPKPKEIMWNPNKNKYGGYEPNWELKWSPYLTKITGLPKEEWESKVNLKCKEMNKLILKKKGELDD